MFVRDRVAIHSVLGSRTGVLATVCVAFAAAVAGCGARHERALQEVFSADLSVEAAKPAATAPQLQAGVYLVEIVEREVDVRAIVAAGTARMELEDSVPRHGLHATVVRLREPGTVRVEARSADYGDKRGSAGLRISRWRYAAEAPPDELESGFLAFGEAGRETAAGDPDAWSRAAEHLRRASALFAQAGDVAGRAQAEYSLGNLEYLLRTQWQPAIRAAEMAAEAYASLDDDTGRHRAAVLRASAEIEIADGMSADSQRAERRALFEAIDRRLREAAEHFAASGERIDEAYTINMRGVGFFSAGDHPRGEALFERASELARRNQDLALLVKTLSNLAWIHHRRGEIARATSEYEALMPLLDRDRDADMYATTISNYGQCLIALGDFDRALSLRAEALEVFTERRFEADRGRQLNALGSLYMRVGELERALATLRAAAELNGRVGNGAGRGEALRLAGNAAGALGDPRAALGYLRESMKQDAQPQQVARTRVLVASQLRALDDLPGAHRELAEAMRTGNELTRAYALAERAHLRRAELDHRGALADARAADAAFVALGLDFDRIETHTLISQSQLELGDVAAALAAADTAIGIEQRIRVASANPEWRARFLGQSYAPYEARIAAELAADGSEGTWRAFRTAEDVRARSLADQLAARARRRQPVADPEGDALRAQLTAMQLRLESRMDTEEADSAGTVELRRSIEELRARIDAHRLEHQALPSTDAGTLRISASLREVQASLPASTAVLAYHVGDGASHAWLLTRDSLRHATLAGRTDLQATAQALIAAAREATPIPAALRDAGRRLFADLLKHTDAKRLLIIPDGPLHGVPFAAIPADAGGAGGLLVERFVLGFAPSLALAMDSPAPASGVRPRVAVISDPVYARDDSRLRLASARDGSAWRSNMPPTRDTLTRLPYSGLEAKTVVRAFGAQDTIDISGFDATPARILELREQPLSVLHFATHALIRREAPEQSALYLSEYSADGAPREDSRLTAEEISRTGLRADLVVLSACATGDGGAVRGEGVLGLTYAFLANGSQAVVASLWPIQDASTARFMKEFYDAYRNTGRASDALRIAQLRARDGAAWASFVVRANGFP